jgi:hypothetical protein
MRSIRFGRKCEGNRPFERPESMWEDNIEMGVERNRV